MTIQFNTDKSTTGTEVFVAPFKAQIEKELKRFDSQITRIEVHLSDDDGKKDGLKAKRCTLEARLGGLNPITVVSHADTEKQAVSEALGKLKASLETRLGRLRNH